jgi:hypothetical protein
MLEVEEKELENTLKEEKLEKLENTLKEGN